MFNKYQVNIHHQIISKLSKTANNNLLYITLILNLNHNKMKVKVVQTIKPIPVSIKLPKINRFMIFIFFLAELRRLFLRVTLSYI